MKIRIKRPYFFLPRSNSLLDWSRSFLLILGALSLAYAGIAILDAKLYQACETWRFEKALEERGPLTAPKESILPVPVSPSPAERNRGPSVNPGAVTRAGIPLGRIEIPSIGLAVMILEGTSSGILHRAVGHIPGTSLPGQRGNVVITGHRDTFFRPLRHIRKDAEITLTTLYGLFLYQVDSTEVVEPEDTKVLDDGDGASLTLVTCYPFYYVGPAPKRFVVRAHKVSG
jgi:sortase A